MMKSFYLLNNTIRDYAWGHLRYIPDFLGIDYPEGKPAAELWMGAHPSSPSMLEGEDGKTMGLDEWITGNPEAVLGSDVLFRYGRLPFLFKLLAAGKSLSIQAHPDKAMAEEGYERENRAGIPVDAPNRNYRDDNHKPEIIMALSPFTAMIGFRNPREIGSVFSSLIKKSGGGTLPADVLLALNNGENEALKPFLQSLLTSKEGERTVLLQGALRAASESGCPWDALQKEWVPKLAAQFPGDVGALAPLFLNLIKINPGEALYQPSRALHAYLDGFGMELMANSDNVLRGGLTPKNVDVPELTRILNFIPSPAEVLVLHESGRGLKYFETPAEEFSLGLSDIDGNDGGEGTILKKGSGPLIILCLDGDVRLEDGKDSLRLIRGASAFIPWCASEVKMAGKGRIAVAKVGS